MMIGPGTLQWLTKLLLKTPIKTRSSDCISQLCIQVQINMLIHLIEAMMVTPNYTFTLTLTGDRLCMVPWWSHGPHLLPGWVRAGGVGSRSEVLVLHAQPGWLYDHMWMLVAGWSEGEYFRTLVLKDSHSIWNHDRVWHFVIQLLSVSLMSSMSRLMRGLCWTHCDIS